jgi:plasmid stabilization system protein ParE
MRLVWAPGALRDLLWFRHYYERVFLEGTAGARDRLRSAERLLLDNPHLGRPLHRPGIRRLTLARTPFFLVYRISPHRIEVLRLIDGRAFDVLLDD